MAADDKQNIDGNDGNAEGNKQQITIKTEHRPNTGGGIDNRDITGNGNDGTIKRGRGRPKGSTNKKTKTTNDKLQKEKAKLYCGLIITLGVTAGNAVFQQDTSLTVPEKIMIETPLENWLASLEPSQLDNVEKYLNPVMFLMGVGMWTKRNVDVRNKRVLKSKIIDIDESDNTNGTNHNQSKPSIAPDDAPVFSDVTKSD